MFQKLKKVLAVRFPEKRLFLRSDDETRYIRLTPATQLVAWAGTAGVVGWSIIATAFLMIDSIGSGSIREQAKREQLLYEYRLNELSEQRDVRASEASLAQQRFNSALEQISQMQLALLASEERRRELETGIDVIQATLRRTMEERDEARGEIVRLMEGAGESEELAAQNADVSDTLNFLVAALADTAAERDAMAQARSEAENYAAELEHERELLEEKNDRIFSQLEDAVSLSLQPLDKMFRATGMSTDHILDTIERGYSGQGGPLTPMSFSTSGAPLAPDTLRANGILAHLDKMNLYRIAAEQIPFDMPVKNAFRWTSGFGMRWGRMHEGTDLAGAHGSPVYSTADGIVIFAGWSGGYGRIVKIQHAFGIETRYAHLAKIRVAVGEKVSRGDRIGDMGSSGRSTGTHLHYEIRVGGKAINPMTYIKAGRNVF